MPPPPSRPRPDGGLSRRGFIRRARLAGGTVLVLAAGGASYRSYDQGVFEAGGSGAYDAWDDWEGGRGPRALVSAAILAANAHDYRAWLFRVTPRVDLTPGPRRRSALFQAIPDRHTDRSAYTSRALAPEVLAQMSALAGGLPEARLYLFDSDADRARIGALMVGAAQAVTRDGQQSCDAFDLFRSSWDDIQEHKDGLTLDAQGQSAFTTTVAKMLPASDRAAGDRFWVDQTRRTHTRTAAAYGIVAVRDAGDNADRLTGGRLLERVHLWSAANGIALQHMNQMTERLDRERQLGLRPRFGRAVQGLIPDDAWQPLSTFRVGYAEGADGRRRSPRRPAAAVIA